MLKLVLTKAAYAVTGTAVKPFELRAPSKWFKSLIFDKQGNLKPHKDVMLFEAYGKHRAFKVYELFYIEHISCAFTYKLPDGSVFNFPDGAYKIHLGKCLYIGLS